MIPLVSATTSSPDRAPALLPEDACPEREVEKGVAAGKAAARGGGGYVFLDEHGLICRFATVPRRLGGKRRAWLVVAVERRSRR
jgi:hypothetical protein